MEQLIYSDVVNEYWVFRQKKPGPHVAQSSKMVIVGDYERSAFLIWVDFLITNYRQYMVYVGNAQIGTVDGL